MGSVNNLAVIIIVLGTASLIMGILEIMKANSARKGWHTVSGAVVESKVVAQRHHDIKENRTSTSYEPVVNYTYPVDGSTLQGNRIGFGFGTYNKAKADQIVARYKPGSQVTVYYDPQKPANAVLETKSKSAATYLICGFALLVIGYILLY